MKLELWIALCGLLISASVSLGGFILWFSNSEKKKYAAERDFNHIRKNQEQTNLALANILAEMDKRFDILDRDVLEIKMNIGMSLRSKRIKAETEEI